jgi:hypothetical protein
MSPDDIASAKILKDGRYGILAWDETILLLKKGYSGEPVIFDPSSGYYYNHGNMRLGKGSVVADASSASGYVLNSSIDDSGVLWFGPYVTLNSGLYKVTYAVKIDNFTTPQLNDLLFTVDVTHSFGQVLDRKNDVIGSYVISNVIPTEQWFNLTLIFGLEEPTQNIEFRGIGVKDHSVSLDYVIVDPISPIEFAFNSSALFVDFGKISDGLVNYEIRSCVLPKGSYTARFWLRLDKPITNYLLNVGLLDVGVSIDPKETLVNSTVYGVNFTDTHSWVPFNLEFKLDHDYDIVEFPVFNIRDEAPISPILVEVLPKGG